MARYIDVWVDGVVAGDGTSNSGQSGLIFQQSVSDNFTIDDLGIWLKKNFGICKFTYFVYDHQYEGSTQGIHGTNISIVAQLWDENGDEPIGDGTDID